MTITKRDLSAVGEGVIKHCQFKLLWRDEIQNTVYRRVLSSPEKTSEFTVSTMRCDIKAITCAVLPLYFFIRVVLHLRHPLEPFLCPADVRRYSFKSWTSTRAVTIQAPASWWNTVNLPGDKFWQNRDFDCSNKKNQNIVYIQVSHVN